MDEAPKLTEEAGYEALQGHLVERALEARRRHGPTIDLAAMERVLADREIVRFPVELRFDAAPLRQGEFAWAMPLGDRPADGFALVVHPHFAGRSEDLPLLIAYHVVSVNYLDVVTRAEAELFGATLLGMEVDEYYRRVCTLADELLAG